MEDARAYHELRVGFTAAVSHELRTPLARLLALLDSAELPGTDRDALLAEAREQVEQMSELIDDVLFLSELESGREVVALGSTPALPVFESARAGQFTRAEKLTGQLGRKILPAGFRAVELQMPYDHSPSVIRAEVERHGVAMLGLNTALGRPGESGLAAVPGRERDFAGLFRQALDYAAAIGASAVSAPHLANVAFHQERQVRMKPDLSGVV